MILVDTSVLIDYLKGIENNTVKTFDRILDMGIPYGINEFIYQEILQGARSLEEFSRLKEYFDTIPLYHLRFGKESFEKAALLNIQCRRAGVTVRSTIDLLIAQTAIENDLYLFHNDKDFSNMEKVLGNLKVYEGFKDNNA